MKKHLIIFFIVFAFTVAVPIIVSFAVSEASTKKDLINIFRQNKSCISLISETQHNATADYFHSAF
ncbi:MAG: hypothetical protein NC213_04575 [Acetobacter sp.]|nr:hypothetical protein [Bacteroides sp.]MCM1341000.1 hypothetical protein [Acetobacter sp.]MCM1432444.1 hypothetical protein [Clostridiales bacterium]